MKLLASILLGLGSLAHAAPTSLPTQVKPVLEDRSIIGDILSGLLSSIESAIVSGETALVMTLLKGISPMASPPTSVDEAAARIQSIVQSSKPNNALEMGVMLAFNGLLSSSVSNLVTDFSSQFSAQNSESNANSAARSNIYSKSSCDAPYSVSEDSLRKAIHIPAAFTYGKKPPVILFAGTGNHGYESFRGNLIPILAGSNWADPVWVNVPQRLLNDAQMNAQYAAYALNYIASVTGVNTTIVSWSQGNIDVQWALKYWPSTRKTTSDHVGISADYKGTAFADFLCIKGLSQCNPAVFQQRGLGQSAFINALRSNGGDSAYVPTTSIYTSLDEVVQPQSGTSASAYLNDARSVGVSNVEIQTACAGKVAGGFYGHEGLLYNPLPLALLKDAMAHPGPGQVSRLDMNAVCSTYLAPGMDVNSMLLTEETILIAGLGFLTGPKTTAEPALQSYASRSGSC